MFNKTYISPERTRTEYVTKEVNIHEHRAPTTESVKLLKEMEAAALERVLSAFSVEINKFQCEVVVFLEQISDKIFVVAKFNLNGKECRSETRLDRHNAKRGRWTIMDIWDAVRNDVATVIATQVLDGEIHAITHGVVSSGVLR